MRLSKLFTKTRKDAPADEVAKNAQLLIKAGYIHKEMAGVYSYLPLGLKVLNKLSNIIREEMNDVGGQEILMTALQVKERYQATGRWDDKVVDDWFKTKLVNGTEAGLGFSHEENLTPIAQEYVRSYRDLPLALYQIQTKFRNELRSKSGIMRGREFLMKDMYTYSLTQKQHEEYYDRIQKAYKKVFERAGIGQQTFLTFASGGSFSKYSQEFQTLSDAGEDTIYLDRKKGVAINKEVYNDAVIKDLELTKADLEEARAIEVGNIFNLGDKFTKPFGMTVDDESGKSVTPIMGCYGIGVSRLMGTIAEVHSDDKGLVWPAAVAPAQVYLICLGDEAATTNAADDLYQELQKAGIEVLYDDRDARAGEKFADADLIGVPYRVVVSQKTLAQQQAEVKKRTSDSVNLVPLTEVKKVIAASK